MKAIRFFIDRPVATLMIYAVFVILGAASFFRMPVDLMPGADSGVLTIFIGIRGGLPPEDIESLVTKPVEDEMAALPNLDDTVSVSRKERAVITLIFKPGTDSSRAALEVQERLARIKGKLPREIEKPVVSRYDENQSPILILALSSKHFNPEELRQLADDQLKPALKRIEGVANVEVGGGRERKILVEFDKTRLEAHGLPIRQVISQIGSENLNILTGKMERSKGAYFVRTVGAFKTIDDIGALPIAVTKEGSRILLRDIADIRDYYLEPESYSRLNREPVVSAYVQKEALANTLTVTKKIKEEIKKFESGLDPRISFSTVSDQSIAISQALSHVRRSLFEGAVLAAIVLLLFLRNILSASFIFVSIPLSLILPMIVMDWAGLSLNVMTISGFAIATGMVVDDSIVVLENIISHRDRLFHQRSRIGHRHMVEEDPDEGRRTLPVRATGEMFLALSASTLTRVIVFVPILFLNPQVRTLYTGLSITVTASLMISLLVSVSVIPCLSGNIPERWTKETSFFSSYAWLYLGKQARRLNAALGRWSSRVKARVKRLMRRKGKEDEDSFVLLGGSAVLIRGRKGFRRYRHWVAVSMRHRYRMAGTLLALMIGCGFLYGRLDKEYVGSTEENEFTIFVELPSGTKLDVSNKVVGVVEKLLDETPEIKKAVKSSVARIEGWSSKIYVTLYSQAERTRSAQDVIDSLRPLVGQVGQEFDAFVYFSEPVSSKEFLIDVFGFDYEKLRDLAVRIAQGLEKVPGLVDVKLRYKPGRPEVRIEMDREKASLFNLTVQDVAESLHAQIRGLRATYFLTPTAQVETVARLKEQYRKTLEDVEDLTLINPRGVLVPIRQIADFEFGLTPSEIWRKDRERMIQVSANRGGTALSKVAESVAGVLGGIEVPTGYYYEFGGDFPKMVETEKESRFAFLIMLLLIYAVLASLFESYSQPLVILTAIPLTVLGAIPLLYVTKTSVTLSAMIGFIMLGGISVSNSIILIDVFNRIRRTKGELRALLQAGQERIRPILMTSLTAILALVPLPLAREGSGSLWKPMAVTVIGGLTASTFLVLIVLPGFYLILEDVRSRLKKSVTVKNHPPS